jgi:hypothetical protein
VAASISKSTQGGSGGGACATPDAMSHRIALRNSAKQSLLPTLRFDFNASSCDQISLCAISTVGLEWTCNMFCNCLGCAGVVLYRSG